ncbi:MAG: hypothetical protein V4719_00965 [Planctomycetota bacterium]
MASETFQKGGLTRDRERRAIALPSNISAETVAGIDALVSTQVNALAAVDSSGFSRALTTVQAINDLRKALTPEIMTHIMAVQNTRLGFKTDKPDGYPVATVKECLIEALLHGAQPTGNEFNIIAHGCYLTLEFFRHKLREWPGLTDLVLELGVPVIGDKGAVVECAANWKINGVFRSLQFRKTEKTADREAADTRICVKVNAGMGYDAVLGKAERKLRARIWQLLTGSVSTHDGEADDLELPKVTSGTQTLFTKPGSAPTESRTAKPAATRQQPESYALRVKKATRPEHLDAIQSNADADLEHGEISQSDYDDLMGLIGERRHVV